MLPPLTPLLASWLAPRRAASNYGHGEASIIALSRPGLTRRFIAKLIKSETCRFCAAISCRRR